MNSSLDLSLSRPHLPTLLEFARVSYTLHHLNPTKLAQFPPLDMPQGPPQRASSSHGKTHHSIVASRLASRCRHQHAALQLYNDICRSLPTSEAHLRERWSYQDTRDPRSWLHQNLAFLSGDASVHAPLSAHRFRFRALTQRLRGKLAVETQRAIAIVTSAIGHW